MKISYKNKEFKTLTGYVSGVEIIADELQREESFYLIEDISEIEFDYLRQRTTVIKGKFTFEHTWDGSSNISENLTGFFNLIEQFLGN